MIITMHSMTPIIINFVAYRCSSSRRCDHSNLTAIIIKCSPPPSISCHWHCWTEVATSCYSNGNNILNEWGGGIESLLSMFISTDDKIHWTYHKEKVRPLNNRNDFVHKFDMKEQLNDGKSLVEHHPEWEEDGPSTSCVGWIGWNFCTWKVTKVNGVDWSLTGSCTD